MQTLTRRHRLAAEASTARIVMANIVSEQALPYNLGAMDDPEKYYRIWSSIVAKEPDHEPEKECLVVFLLNSRLTPFAWNRVSLGGCSETYAHPREILRPVIAGNAHAFVLMHNHPSGDASSTANSSPPERSHSSSHHQPSTINSHTTMSQDTTPPPAAGTHEAPIRYESLDRKAPDYREKFNRQLDQAEQDAKAGKVICLSDLMGNSGM